MPFTYSDVEMIEEEIFEFLRAVRNWQARADKRDPGHKSESRYMEWTKESSALKRASMELSRALRRMRRRSE